MRQEGQSVASYIAELRKMNKFCKFAYLDEQIKDRIACGIHNTGIQGILLAKIKLNLQIAIDISIGAELTDEQLTTLEHHDTDKVFGVYCTPWRRTENSGIQDPNISKKSGVYNL